MPPSPARVRNVSHHPVRPDREFVLYWMTSARRASFNFSLDRAVHWASELGRPLVVLEPLRMDYRWASDRFHGFVVDGMQDNSRALRHRPATYYPYVEPAAGAAKGLVRSLASRACVVVTDDFPAFFLPPMLAAAARQVDVQLEAVDANGVIPLRATSRDYPSAHTFRRFVHQYLAEHGIAMPERDPLANQRLPRLDVLPAEVTRRWPPTGRLDDTASLLSPLSIDHDVQRPSIRGGARAGSDLLKEFVGRKLERYQRERNDPEANGASGLSPYLHFGHTSVHEVLECVIAANAWSPDAVEVSARGSRAGWGGLGDAGAFLDQLITWRELGYNMCAHRSDYDQYGSLPDWARKTLAEHAGDPREPGYDLEQFDHAATHDHLWNAAQRQLRRTGTIHNYLRMLWGKKILEWTRSPQDALAVMVELNNRYALDGRDPNSYSGIFWTLGRYDRPWGPERPVFGKVRYMSSANTRRKLHVAQYLQQFGA